MDACNCDSLGGKVLLGCDVARPSARPVLLLDFDGTVCLGDGPVIAYAEAAFSALPEDRRANAFDRLRRFLDHEPALRRQYADGYVLVQELCSVLPPVDLRAAYLSSRERLAATGLGVVPASGLTELLVSVGQKVTTIVLTNSPAIGVVETLDRFGLSGLLDQVIVDGGKPSRMAEHLDILLGDRPPSTLISIGDHWMNDVRVPLLRGTFGGLITSAVRPDQSAHLVGPDIASLASGIACWASDPYRFEPSCPERNGRG